MPQAIFFGLDETLVDRTRSIAHYAERFPRDFTDRLAPCRPLRSLPSSSSPTVGAIVRVRNRVRDLWALSLGRRRPRPQSFRRIG